MIGNTDDATRALLDYRDYNNRFLLSNEGSTRMVYLINGVVYKIESYEDGVNLSEFETVNSVELQEGFAFPETALYSVLGENIIAMEYVEGMPLARCYCADTGDVCAADCLDTETADYLDSLGLDSSGFNTIVADQTYYIIDAGSLT